MTKPQSLLCALLIVMFLMAAYAVISFSKETDSQPTEAPQAYELPDKVMTYRQIEKPSRGGRVLIFEATAYDLSVQCCGKPYGHPARGITANGYDLNNITREQAMTIGSNDFPLGTKLELVFDEPHSHFNGIYTVRDTGNMKPNVIDVFVGDFGEQVSQDAIQFGRQTVRVQILRSDDYGS